MSRLACAAMGGFKAQAMEEDAQGWEFTDEMVCTDCIAEPALQAVVSEHSHSGYVCDFCGGDQSAPLDVLLGTFFDGLRNEYEDIDSAGVPYDGREGGYLVYCKWDTWDLIEEFADVFAGEGLLERVHDAAKQTLWVENDYVTRRRDVALQWSWDEFCDIVKFKKRYVLWLTDDEDLGAGEIPPSRILDRVRELVRQHGLVRIETAGSRYWRARIHSEPSIEHSAKCLGTAPAKKAAPNRMSPAGIPMFYGADDAVTAVCEVADGCEGGVPSPQDIADNRVKSRVTYGQFSVSSDITIVDFTSVPEVPSMFHPELGSQHREVSFLRAFADQISRSINPQQEQVDYVPSQIVTEYLLHGALDGEPIEGLMYKSSRADGKCIALPVPQEKCVDDDTDEPGHLVLHHGTVECHTVNCCSSVLD